MTYYAWRKQVLMDIGACESSDERIVEVESHIKFKDGGKFCAWDYPFD